MSDAPGALQTWYQSQFGTLIALYFRATFKVLMLNEIECVAPRLMEFGVFIGYGWPWS